MSDIMSKLAARYAEVNENKKMTNQKALSKASAATPAGKAAVTLPKAPWDKKKESKEAMDPVDKKELKGKHKDRDDTDIDNDGDTDSSDKYLHKRRKAISKKMDEAEDKTTPCPKCEGSMENHSKDCPSEKEAKSKDDTAVMNPGKGKEEPKMEKNESYTFKQLEAMSIEDLDSLSESMDNEQLDEILGTLAKGAASLAGKGVKKAVNRFSVSGRADAAQAKLKKMTKKRNDRNRLNKAKAGISKLRATKPVSARPLAAGVKEGNEMAEPKWPVYARILEKAMAPKKDAEKPEEIDAKDSKSSKDFVDDHEKSDDKKQGDKVDIAVAIKKNASALANPMKAAPLRPGDNKQGDKVADKPEGKM